MSCLLTVLLVSLSAYQVMRSLWKIIVSVLLIALFLATVDYQVIAIKDKLMEDQFG